MPNMNVTELPPDAIIPAMDRFNAMVGSVPQCGIVFLSHNIILQLLHVKMAVGDCFFKLMMITWSRTSALDINHKDLAFGIVLTSFGSSTFLKCKHQPFDKININNVQAKNPESSRTQR